VSRLVLVRHAATDWSGVRFCGRTDLPLNELGRRQVAALVARVADIGLSVLAVGSSPARRAVETAAPLARALAAPLELDDRLREADFGLVEGSTFDAVARTWPVVARALLAGGSAIDWPAGERAADLARRLRPVATELATATGDTLLVTHGGVVRALLGLLDVPKEAGIDVAPAQLVVLQRGPRWHVVDRSAPTVSVTGTSELKKGAAAR
jgi:broad specificity phosphatase PhoE